MKLEKSRALVSTIQNIVLPNMCEVSQLWGRIDVVYIHPRYKNYFLTITCEKTVKIIGERRGSH
jgi:hypothetical protein